MSDTTRKLAPSSSHAALISELTDYKRHLWTLLAELKKKIKHIPVAERDELLKAMLDAERALL